MLEVRDLWPESLVGVGQATADSLLYRSIGRVAEFLIGTPSHSSWMVNGSASALSIRVWKKEKSP